MKRKAFINGLGSVSIQPVGFSVLKDQPEHLKHLNYAQHPSYKELIAPAMLRRMGSSIKMSIYASHKAIEDAGNVIIDAIIVGTAWGCIQDSEKFLDSLYENNEQYLTPTSFIQSTHNTVGAQIALKLNCKGYNMTYVNGANSFESALFDGIIQVIDKGQDVLVGGVDEIAPYTYSMFELIEKAKSEENRDKADYMDTPGILLSEGSNFCVVSSKKDERSYAELVAVEILNHIPTDFESYLKDFLADNGLELVDIDLTFIGTNADAKQHQHFAPIIDVLKDKAIAYYQHISGSNDTISAFGFKAACEVLKSQSFPDTLRYSEKVPEKLDNVLLINQLNGRDFSVVLLSSC